MCLIFKIMPIGDWRPSDRHATRRLAGFGRCLSWSFQAYLRRRLVGARASLKGAPSCIWRPAAGKTRSCMRSVLPLLARRSQARHCRRAPTAFAAQKRPFKMIERPHRKLRSTDRTKPDQSQGTPLCANPPAGNQSGANRVAARGERSPARNSDLLCAENRDPRSGLAYLRNACHGHRPSAESAPFESLPEACQAAR